MNSHNLTTDIGQCAVTVLMLLFISNAVTALNLEIVVVDYNTLEAIENADVKVYNGTTLIDENTTNSIGIVNFTLNAENYTIVTTAISYEGDNTDYELDADSSLLIALVPYSPTGIIRVTYSDLSGIRIDDWFGGNHELCFYFVGNDRLDDCYNGNETIQLTEQQDYIIRITPTRQDMINSPNNLGTFTRQYTNYLVGLLFIISIIMVVYYVQKKLIAK